MAETATAGRDAQDVQASASHSGIAEFILRAIGAILQLASTWALVHALTPEAAGVYFRGFVIACGLGALLRSKYELYMAHYILGMRSKATGISNGALLFLLGRRVLLRASLVCGALLVVTTDIDIQAPRFQPVLETYLPFILAIPFVSLSTFLGEALRAGHRSLFGMMVAAFALNLSILLVVALAAPDAPLSVYTWAFLGGSIASAALATLLAWRAFPMCAAAQRPIVREVLEAVDERALIGVSRGLLLWGPLCVLAVWAPAVQMAQYAVAARTALIVDFFLPALSLAAHQNVLPAAFAARPGCSRRKLLMRQLGAALLYSSCIVAAMLIAAPVTLAAYGPPYTSLITVYALLLGVQWINGVGDPAVRDAVVGWDARRIQLSVGSGALAAVLICAFGVAGYGALAAATGALIGALIVNARAIAGALQRSRQAAVSV
jgi:hypothetical protein